MPTLSSFRGAPVDAMVRQGAPSAIVRAEATREDRTLLIEARPSSLRRRSSGHASPVGPVLEPFGSRLAVWVVRVRRRGRVGRVTSRLSARVRGRG